MSTRKKTATLTGRTDTTTTNTTTGSRDWRKFFTTPTFTIVKDYYGDYFVTRNGDPLTDRNYRTRFFVSRNSARKRISRERRQDFHN